MFVSVVSMIVGARLLTASTWSCPSWNPLTRRTTTVLSQGASASSSTSAVNDSRPSFGRLAVFLTRFSGTRTRGDSSGIEGATSSSSTVIVLRFRPCSTTTRAAEDCADRSRSLRTSSLRSSSSIRSAKKRSLSTRSRRVSSSRR